MASVSLRGATASRTALRLFLGFALALVAWSLFSQAYERLLAETSERILRTTERPSVTRLEAARGSVRVDRRDFPSGSPRPGLPAADIHFNFVLMISLFALDPHPWHGARVGRLAVALLLLFFIHAAALVFQVQSVYATALGPWSEAHYGALARNFWAGGFHFYQIAGRFAAPFALWWAFGRREGGLLAGVSSKPETAPRKRKR